MNCNELNHKISNWNSEDEEVLINKLKDYCDRYKVYCETLDNDIKAIERNIDITNIDLLNGVNALNKLSINKYAVFTIDSNEQIEKENNETNKLNGNYNKEESSYILSNEEKESNRMMIKYKTAIEMSIDNLGIRQLTKNKGNKEKKMKLPCLIGTKEFFLNETLGLLNENACNAYKNELHENKSVYYNETNRRLSDKNDNNKSGWNNDSNSISQLQKKKEGIKIEGDNMRIKSYNLFNFGNMNEDQEDIDEVLIKQYNSPQFTQNQMSNKKDKPMISIDQFVKNGLFDLDDEEDNSNTENNDNNELNKKSISSIISNEKETENKQKKEAVKSNKEDLQTKLNLPNKNKKQEKESSFNLAKQKLFELFDDENDDESNSNSNQIEKITKKTNEFTNKLKQIAGEQQNTPNQNIKSNSKFQNEIKTYEIQKKKKIKKPLFMINDEEYEENKQTIINENNEMLKGNENSNHSEKLNSIFNDDNNNDAKATVNNNNKNDKQLLEQGKEIKPLLKNQQLSFEETKACLNNKSTSFPIQNHTLVAESNQQYTTASQLHNTHTNTIYNQDTNITIIKKKKPNKPIFNSNNNNNNISIIKKDTPSFLSNPQLKPEALNNNTLKKNKSIANQKTLIKFNFNFDDDE